MLLSSQFFIRPARPGTTVPSTVSCKATLRNPRRKRLGARFSSSGFGPRDCQYLRESREGPSKASIAHCIPTSRDESGRGSTLGRRPISSWPHQGLQSLLGIYTSQRSRRNTTQPNLRRG